MASERADRQADVAVDGILLGLLSAVERDSAVTQRHLALELGIALGLINAYVRRCAKKGLIKIRRVPLNRYSYYLTPRGFAEKSRLTAEYLKASFDFFGQARRDCRALLCGCGARGWRHVVLYGAGDLAEIAALSAREAGVTVICIIDAEADASWCAGLPVLRDWEAARRLFGGEGIDSVVITDIRSPQRSFDAMRMEASAIGLSEERILAPDLLRISPAIRHAPVRPGPR